VPAWAGRNKGPFCPHAASRPAALKTAASDKQASGRAQASARDARHDRPAAKTAPRAGGQCAAKLDPLLSFIRRILSTMSTTTLQDPDYHAAADRLLAAVERQCDDWLQQGVIDIDSNRAGGLLELEFPDGSKIVLNKQPPLHEIWLAARNGGFHFKRVDDAWRDTRDGAEFFARLSDEVSRQAGKPLRWVAG
jgi:CyaY protein